MRRERPLDARGHTGGARMSAGPEHRQHVGSPAVRIERCRRVCAGIQEPDGDLGGVGGDDLASNLHTVGGASITAPTVGATYTAAPLTARVSR